MNVYSCLDVGEQVPAVLIVLSASPAPPSLYTRPPRLRSMQAGSFPLNTVRTETGRGTQARLHATPISSVSHLASQITQSLRYMIPSITCHKIFCLEVSVVEGGKGGFRGTLRIGHHVFPRCLLQPNQLTIKQHTATESI